MWWTTSSSIYSHCHDALLCLWLPVVEPANQGLEPLKLNQNKSSLFLAAILGILSQLTQN
jgi:hypothetical protein